MPNRIRVLLLGPPAVYLGDQPVEIARREVRTLLFYLACQRAPVSRGDLTALFWPEYPEENARKRLRETLARLKKALPDGNILMAAGDRLGLEHAGFSCDVLEFEDILEEVSRPLAQIPATTPLPEPVYQKMTRAARLWRSPLFFSGGQLPRASFLDHWRSNTEQNLEAAHMHLLERLADHEIAAGSLDQAATWLRSAVEINPLSDAIHKRMVTVFEHNGYYNDALAYLEQVREMYEREGLAGLPFDLRQAEAHLRSGHAQPHGTTPARWPGRRMVQLPLFGRKMELGQLQTAYRRGGVVLLKGETGAGKTRLVQELFRTLTPAPRLMVALSRPLENSLPFQPLIDMLRSQVTADEWQGLLPVWLSALSLLLPELKAAFPDLPLPQAPVSLSQPVLFEALRQALVHLARSQRIVLFMDDVQWCDETSLSAAAYLNDHGLFEQHGILILACRVDEETPALERLINHISSSAPLLEISLAPLTEQDVAEMAHFLLGQKIPQTLVERIRQDTGGNPLFLVESLRTLLELPVPLSEQMAGGLGRLPLSGSIHALVHQRVEGLSPDAHLALTVAAVMGSDFSLNVLEQTGALQGERLANALDELVRRHLLEPSSSTGGALEYHFIHDRIREIILLELGPARRRVYNLRVANALKNQYAGIEDAHSAVLAFHYEEAGELTSAFSYWLKAGMHARKLYSRVEADTAYRRAETLLEQLGPLVPDQDALLLYSSWAEFAFNIANIDTLEHATQGMLQAGYRRQSATLIGHGYLAQAAVSDLRDQPAQGLLQLEDARKILSGINDPNDPAWLKYHFQRGGFFILQNHYEEGIEEFEQSIQSLQDTHNPRLIEARSNLRYRLGMAYTLNGWPAKGYRQAELLMDDSRRTLSHAARARGFTIMAICEYYLARFPAALEHGAMALRMVTPMQNSRLEGTIRANQAQTELALGHIDQAWEQAALALAAGREGGFERVISEALRIRGDIHRLFGNFETAEALYRAGSDSAGDNYTKMDSLHRLGFVMARSGRVEEGLAIIDQAIEFCQKNELNLYLLSAQAAKARILLLNGRNQESAELARQMVIQAAEREIPMMRPQGYLILGSQALIEGHADEAGQKILASMRIAREIQHPLLEMNAIELALVSLKKQEQDLCQLHERLQMLLDSLDKNTRHPDLRPAFEQFAEKYKNL